MKIRERIPVYGQWEEGECKLLNVMQHQLEPVQCPFLLYFADGAADIDTARDSLTQAIFEQTI
jgi:hypothetical protein